MEFEFAMPAPPNEICSLCDCEMGMIWISHGGEKERIGWRCECGGTRTTCVKKEIEMPTIKSESGLKLCKDCKYVDTVWQMNCTLRDTGIDLVGGKHRYESASLQRSYWNIIIWRCGRKGRFWEKREWKTSLEIARDILNETLDEIKEKREKKNEHKTMVL